MPTTSSQLLYNIALTQIEGIGCVQAKILLEQLGSSEAIFKASKKQLENIEGIGSIKANSIVQFKNFAAAEAELKFIEQQHIMPLFITDDDYPKRLQHCYDAPTLLYYKGTANLNTAKVISIIGTRNNSHYGKEITEKIIKELQAEDVLIVSGLAFGIDAIAHKAAIENNMATVGVLAHGLDSLYPNQHSKLAQQMLKHGGLLTEFTKGTTPDKHNFPKRNRIVAGMADATMVIETGLKGGSIITAELAYNYNKDVFAIPGKITDTKSEGCNSLIQHNKAVIFTSTKDFLDNMGWINKEAKKTPAVQRSLFVQMTEEEQTIYHILFKQNTALHIDELYIKSGLSSTTVAACILNLELNNCIESLPGKLYKAL